MGPPTVTHPVEQIEDQFSSLQSTIASQVAAAVEHAMAGLA